MSYDIQITDQADKDLRGIYTYIAFALLAPENAAGQLDRLETAINSLSDMPNRFRKYDREPWHSKGLRVLPVDNYIVFYTINDDVRVVDIIRVMYQGQNIDRELNIN